MRFSASMNFPLPIFGLTADVTAHSLSAQPFATRAPISEPQSPPQHRQLPDDDGDLARRVRETGEW